MPRGNPRRPRGGGADGAGRRVLVYATHTGTRDITESMDDILTWHGFRVGVMKPKQSHRKTARRGWPIR